MRLAKVLYDEIRDVQEKLGRGEVEEALVQAPRVRLQALDLLAGGATLTSFERTYAAAAATFATITTILALSEGRPPAESVPAIRALAIETTEQIGLGLEVWKVLAAAGEMLARSGDASGAAWAVLRARRMSDEDYLIKLNGSIRSMYPQAFAEMGDPPPEVPPPLA